MKIVGIDHWSADFGIYNTILLRVRTDEGIEGHAEVAMRRRTRSVQALLTEFTDELVGKDPTRIEQIVERLYRDAFIGNGILGIAISGIDMALWDLNAQMLGVPLHRLFGGKFRDSVPVYTHARAGESPEFMANEVADRVDQGFKAIKTTLPGFYSEVTSIRHKQAAQIPAQHTETEILPTWTWRMIAEFFEATRERVGPDIHLMVDCHGRLNVPNAIRLCEALEPYNLTFIEEPVSYERPDWLAEVSRRSTTPIAAGERWGNHFASAPFIEQHSVAIAQPDVGICGGLLAAKKIASIAEAHAISIAFHNPFGPMQTAATLQLAATLPNLLITETMFTPAQATYWERYVENPPRIVDGEWVVTDDTGVGPRLRIDEIERYPMNIGLDIGGTR